MALHHGFLADELRRRKIRLSPQRVKVLEFLCSHQLHPTADEIYIDVHEDVPSLSKTTVYNTLHILIAAGLVREVNIDGDQIRYDIIIRDHGHLKCIRCGSIADFDIDPASLATEGLTGFRVLDKSVYFRGICPRCLADMAGGRQAVASAKEAPSPETSAREAATCRKR